MEHRVSIYLLSVCTTTLALSIDCVYGTIPYGYLALEFR
jgi:hypothetical protein